MAENDIIYDNFSVESIKTNGGAGSKLGWVNASIEINDNDTPINAENLNAMLNMLVAIKALLGEKVKDYRDQRDNIFGGDAESLKPQETENA